MMAGLRVQILGNTNEPEPGLTLIETMKIVNGTTLAIAAAALLHIAPVVASETSGKIRCHGVNACRGQGSCAGVNNQCAGQNSCRGKGIKEFTKAACEEAGGTALDT